MLDDALQRRAPGRVPDGLATQPFLLHRPLPPRAGRHSRHQRLQSHDDVLDERHGLPGAHSRLQDPEGQRGYVRFELYSVPNGRKVTIGTPVVKNLRPASDTIQYTSTLPAGATKRIESPVDGKQVWRTVTVRDSQGDILHRVTYYSNYSRVTGLTLVGKGATPGG